MGRADHGTEVQRRLDGGGNSIIFLAAHLADTRHFLLARVGHPLVNPSSRYLADARSIEDIGEWPTLEEMRRAWDAVSAELSEALDRLDAPAIERPGAHRFPIPDTTALGMLAFLAQHDSYHVGCQAAFSRREPGKPAMSHTRATAAAV